jgi:hypothetical protein
MRCPPHVIDVTVIDGLLDIIALGNIIEFAAALDWRSYEHIILHDDEKLEIEIAITRYRTFIRWFGKKFGLLIDGNWITPSYLFKHRLISFAATVCVYFAKEAPNTQRQSELQGMSPSLVKRHFRHHIQICWPDLLAAFEHLLDVDGSSIYLYYTGPPIRLIRKTELNLLKENLVDKLELSQYSKAPIYRPVEVPPSVDEQAAQPPAEKRSYLPTGSATSPSQQKVAKRTRK